MSINITKESIRAAGSALRDSFDRGEQGFEDQARSVLAATAPQLMAAAWDEGANAGYHAAIMEGPNEEYERPTNPYRETGSFAK